MLPLWYHSQGGGYPIFPDTQTPYSKSLRTLQCLLSAGGGKGSDMSVYKSVTFPPKPLCTNTIHTQKTRVIPHTELRSSAHFIVPFRLWLTTKDIPKKTCGGTRGAALPVCIFPMRCCNPTVSCLLTYKHRMKNYEKVLFHKLAFTKSLYTFNNLDT